MLDPKLVAYLREHPDVFSNVIAHLLHEPDGQHFMGSFGGKRKGKQVQKQKKETKKRRQEPPPSAPNLWDDVLVEDVRTNEILRRLLEDVKRNDRVLIDLLLLAMVSKNLRRDVKVLVEKLETRLEIMPLYCRALFEYTREADTFNFFLERIEEHAPATHAAWLVLVRDDTVRSELGQIMDYLRRHRPRHFEAALAKNGFDPIATALCMHHMARPSMGFDAATVKKLQPFVVDQVWACFFMMWEDLAFVRMPNGVSVEEALHACLIRCPLEGGVDFFIPLLLKLMENVDLDRPFSINGNNAIWKRLAQFDASLPIRIYRELAPFNGFRLPLDPDMFYQWLKASVARNKEVGLDLSQAIFLNMNEATVILGGDPFLNVHESPILAAGARFCARRSVPPAVFLDVIHHINGTIIETDHKLHFMSSGLEWAILRGNRPFVHSWITHVWPVFKAIALGGGTDLTIEEILVDALDALTDLNTVAKSDDDAATQTLLGKLLVDEVPSLLNHFRGPLKWMTLCLGDQLHALLVKQLGGNDDPLRSEFDEGNMLFKILHQGSLEGVKRVISEWNESGNSEYYTLVQWLRIATHFLPYRTLFARALFDEVLENAETILELGDYDNDVELWDSLFQDPIPGEFKWRLVHSNYFATFFPSFDRVNKRFGFAALMYYSSNPLLLATKLLALLEPAHQLDAMEAILPNSVSEHNNAMYDRFVDWNLVFKCLGMPAFVEDTSKFQRLSYFAALKQLHLLS